MKTLGINAGGLLLSLAIAVNALALPPLASTPQSNQLESAPTSSPLFTTAGSPSSLLPWGVYLGYRELDCVGFVGVFIGNGNLTAAMDTGLIQSFRSLWSGFGRCYNQI